MKFRYVNSRGEVLDMSEFPYLFQSGDLLNYSWSYDTSNNRITNVRREAGERPFKVGLIPDWSLPYEEKRAALKEAAERFYNIVEYDVVNDSDGRIESDTGSYFPCRIMVSEKNDWENPKPYMFYDVTAVSGKNAWITEYSKSFYASAASEEQADFLDFPYDYEYDYARQATGRGMLNIDHVSESLFKLTIFGECTNPRIMIAGHPYQVYTSLGADEYLIIDARKNTVIKYLSNGAQQDIYDLRGKEQSAFEPVPPGNVQVSWDGSFGFDITLYLERSEPKWS